MEELRANIRRYHQEQIAPQLNSHSDCHTRTGGSHARIAVSVIVAAGFLLFAANGLERVLTPTSQIPAEEAALPSPSRIFLALPRETSSSLFLTLPGSADFYLQYSNPPMYWSYRHGLNNEISEVRAVPVVRYAFR